MTSRYPRDTRPTPFGPKRNPVASAVWPVPAIALEALLDMGMSEEAIARYFGIDAAAVRLARAGAAAQARATRLRGAARN